MHVTRVELFVIGVGNHAPVRRLENVTKQLDDKGDEDQPCRI
jgi:hypothetical protein